MSKIKDPPAFPDVHDPSYGLKAYNIARWIAEAAPQFNDVRNEVMDALANANLGFVSQSTTSTLIDLAEKTIVVQSGRGYVPGMPIKVTSSASIGNFMKGAVKTYNSTTGELTFIPASKGGAGTFAAWSVSFDIPDVSVPSIVRSERTANAMLVTADKGKFIDITSGSFTQTLDAAATLGNGWWCYIRNSGVGDITLDANGSELIDGVLSGLIKGTYLLTCDGTGFSTQRIGAPAHQVILTSGTSWTAWLGCKQPRLRLVGGGGGGGTAGSDGTVVGSGGGGGGVEALLNLVPGAAYTYAIGAGGAVGVSAAGSAGGNTTFTANGVSYTGSGGGGSYFDGGAGGTGTGSGAATYTGSKGSHQVSASTSNGVRGVGGNSFLGSYGRGGNGGGAVGQATAGTAGAIILEW